MKIVTAMRAAAVPAVTVALASALAASSKNELEAKIGAGGRCRAK